MTLSPKTILITGANSGLGKALALKYASPETRILLTGRNKNRLNEVEKLCINQGAKTSTLACDIREKKTLEEWIIKESKTSPIDLVIANAGISGGTASGEESLEQTESILSTNINGVLYTINAALPIMQKAKNGQIAIIGSLAGYRGLPSAPAYSTSKAAIRIYGEALRGNLKKDNIGVTVVTPGFIKTPLTDINQFPMPFLMSAEKAANIIKKRLQKNPPRIAFPWLMYSLILLLTFLPMRITDLIFNQLPKK